MSEDVDVDDRDSVGNVSDEGNASLVGFGEGANSTISGPTSRPPVLNRMSSGGARPTSMGTAGVNPNVGRPNALASYVQQQQQQYGAGYGAADSSIVSSSLAGSITPEPVPEDARMVNGMTFDEDVIDTTVRTPRLATPNPTSGGFDTGHE